MEIKTEPGPILLQHTEVQFRPNRVVFRGGLLYFASLGAADVVVTDATGAFREYIDLLGAMEVSDNRRGDVALFGFTVDEAGSIYVTVPVLFRVGLGLPYQVGHDGRLLFVADAFHPNDNSESVNVGAEYAMREVVAVRAGYQGIFLQDSEVGLTLGAGVNGRFEGYRYRCDYGWTDQGRLGSAHRLTVGIGF